MEKVTLKTIASKLNLDVSTVSRALKDDERVKPATMQRVKALADKLDYIPDLLARSLVTGKSQIVGIILPELRHIFYSEIFEEYSKIALENGLLAELLLTEFNPLNLKRVISQVHAQRLAGVVIAYHQVGFPALKESLKNDFAVVLIDQEKDDNLDTVTVDSEKGVREAMEYLISLGHSRIGFISDEVTGPVRFNVYREVMKEKGISAERNLVDIRSGRSEEAGYQSGLKFLNTKERPTAIFCANDLVALGVMKAAFESGLEIPGDLSIIGFDDLSLSSYFPVPLTTVRQPIREIARQSFHLLLERIEHPRKEVRNIVLPSELIIRKTTDRAKESL